MQLLFLGYKHVNVVVFFQLFIGFGFPYEGPAPLEAIANGCIFLQPKFQPPHSSLNHEFFRGKPTSREVTSLGFTLPIRQKLGLFRAMT